ncbi:hypothetical protein AW736_03230 [Termitidicoccus mucosus]|uniref:Uncharacterized protein n=1 Tax=Termitidicoccus mucosus TaxID=1184151 RepID=A0A178IP51_9BACT|nr:hypothetical protein AW736_03230 [Opitutaceae bacterium TSB47]
MAQASCLPSFFCAKRSVFFNLGWFGAKSVLSIFTALRAPVFDGRQDACATRFAPVARFLSAA